MDMLVTLTVAISLRVCKIHYYNYVGLTATFKPKNVNTGKAR